MTNADKYLKDNVSVEEFARDIDKAYNETEGYVDVYLTIKEWVKQPATPTLTEDERAILRNIDPRECNVIGRDKNTEELYLAYSKIAEKEDREYLFDVIFPTLFQFIKERRRISDRRAFERRIIMGEEVEQTNEQYIQEMITRKGIQEGAFTDKELYNLKLFSENYFELRDYNIELQENLYKEKEKNNTLEKLLQGNLYEMYLYYKEVAGRYQASCISKETIKDKIKEKIERYNTYGEQPYADETINNIVISELKELLKGE